MGVVAAAWGSVAWRGEYGMGGSDVSDIGKEDSDADDSSKEESIVGSRDGDDTSKEDSGAHIGQSVKRDQRTTRGKGEFADVVSWSDIELPGD